MKVILTFFEFYLFFGLFNVDIATLRISKVNIITSNPKTHVLIDTAEKYLKIHFSYGFITVYLSQ